MSFYELIAGGTLVLIGIVLGATILWHGIRIGVNMTTRPESFRMPGGSKTEMDENTV